MEIKIDLNLNLKNIESVVNLLSKCMSIENNINNETNILTKEVANNLVTDEMIRTIIAKLTKCNKGEKAKNILQTYKAVKVSQIDKKDYEKIYKELKKELEN